MQPPGQTTITLCPLFPTASVNRCRCRYGRERGVAFDINARAVRTLALQMRRLGGKLIHLSSDFVFDGMQSRAYRPDDECRPLSVYGHSKLAGEQMAGSDALIVRTSWVYAAAGTNFLDTMLRLMAQQRKVRVVADQIGAPTWAGRLAEVIWRLADTAAPGIYHYVDAGAASWYDFAVAIAEEAGALRLLPHPVSVVPISSADFAPAATRPRFSLLDSSGTLRATQLEPVHWRTNLRAALRELVAMRRVNPTD
ncbi:dTDP-4-dehydrorhamnose reductase [Parafrankia sp. BMG5.11]|uniref:dTDP-4-dehydrorhamnose reductase n=1 Tax=Parafrankia sp. BMG5.11 TaxID=222540 RepID=UPI00103D6C78|nr:dTDP-4-dehydrorhamnose reductase [Parafrankia sp. BMG5.11]TCJ39582.1 dTDP-4-dehydrorhamnose reductase [Parafrankia sp. BMG5.11]